MQIHESRQPVWADAGPDTVGTSRMLLTVAAAWVLSLGFDVFLHAGLLARLYVEPSPFLLGPEEAFRRIPLGYLAFLVLTMALYWFLRRLGVRGTIAGLRYGAAAGAVVWGGLRGWTLFHQHRAVAPPGWLVDRADDRVGTRGRGARIRREPSATETDLGCGGSRGARLHRGDHYSAVAWLGSSHEDRALSAQVSLTSGSSRRRFAISSHARC